MGHSSQNAHAEHRWRRVPGRSDRRFSRSPARGPYPSRRPAWANGRSGPSGP